MTVAAGIARKSGEALLLDLSAVSDYTLRKAALLRLARVDRAWSASFGRDGRPRGSVPHGGRRHPCSRAGSADGDRRSDGLLAVRQSRGGVGMFAGAAGDARRDRERGAARERSGGELAHARLHQDDGAFTRTHSPRYGSIVGKDVAAAICATAERVAADIVIVGSHTRSRVRHLFLESASGDVLTRSRRPVLVVPDPGAI